MEALDNVPEHFCSQSIGPGCRSIIWKHFIVSLEAVIVEVHCTLYFLCLYRISIKKAFKHFPACHDLEAEH